MCSNCVITRSVWLLNPCCRAEIFQLLVALIMLGVSVLFDQVSN